jgi:hypothetical protein
MTTHEWAVKVTFGNGTHVIDSERSNSKSGAINRQAHLRWSFPAREDPGPEDVADLLVVRREVGPWEDK